MRIHHYTSSKEFTQFIIRIEYSIVVSCCKFLAIVACYTITHGDEAKQALQVLKPDRISQNHVAHRLYCTGNCSLRCFCGDFHIHIASITPTINGHLVKPMRICTKWRKQISNTQMKSYLVFTNGWQPITNVGSCSIFNYCAYSQSQTQVLCSLYCTPAVHLIDVAWLCMNKSTSV